MVPVALGLTWWGGWPFNLLIIGAAGLLAREWSRLCGVDPQSGLGVALIAGIVLTLLAALVFDRHVSVGLAGLGLSLPLFLLANRSYGRQRAFWLAFGTMAILPAGLSLVWMRATEPHGLILICWVMAVVWVTDSAAFGVGRAVGGPLLAPKISPAKTWAGLAGGLTAATLIGGAAPILLGHAGVALAAFVGLVVGIAAALGDLFESYIKRKFKAKDSGGLIPGHGGVLDRLDSLLAAAPVTAAIYLAGWRWL